MPKIVITDYGFSTLAAGQLIIREAAGGLAAFQCRDVIAAAKDANALIVQWASIMPKAIRNFPACRVIVRYGIGTDNLDLDAARNRGIIVCNVPDYCIDEVADHAFTLAMFLSRQIPVIDQLS
jgi:D-3-phosphoglycerate dehydrogenase / 2-oxoglutarate reductase